MSVTVTLPFHAVRLKFHRGSAMTAPLSDANALHLQKPLEELAGKFADRFQKRLINLGQYEQVMNELYLKEFQRSTVTVAFPAAKDGISYPAFELTFDCFSQQQKEGVWGVLPALGLECLSPDEEQLPNRMEEIVRVDFTAKKRLQAVQSILTAIWFEAAEIEHTDIELTFHTPSELLSQQQKQKRLILPKVATQLKPGHAVAYGREEELTRMDRILRGRFSKNILLVGASGMGKTALVQEIAFRRSKLENANAIWETTASRLIKELTKETGWQDNLSHLLAELAQKGDILFVRNLAELFQVGKYEGNTVSMADYLRPSISRGEFAMITECTPEERARIEAESPNYLAHFQTIELHEPTEGLEDIIMKKVQDLAGRNQVEFGPGAIEEAVRLHRRFMPYSGLPGKPIRFLEGVLLSKSELAAQKFAEQKKKKTKKDKKKKKEPQPPAKPLVIDRQTVLAHFSSESGMPLFLIDPALPMDVGAIRSQFNNNVFGQERAVGAVTGLLAAVKTALTRTGKPIASFLFVGPTGVGKTELAKVLAEFTFGSRDRMVRFDMSEFSNQWSVMRLTGQHVGAEGLLTSAVRREPFCVLLFDEIEKAHPTFFDLLLQILGEGRLSDSRSKLVNFCSAIIVMTSNIGAGTLQQHRIGWKKGLDSADVTAHFTREVEKNFKPELFNRIDSMVAFEPLSAETVRYVVEREIQQFRSREGIRFRRLDMDISEPALDLLAAKGYDPRYGARYLQRTIREMLIIPLAYRLNQFDHDDRLSIRVAEENGQLDIEASSDPLAFDLLMEQWDRLTLAEEASNLRRKMAMLVEGPLIMRLQSELDVLENDKKRLKKAFWENLAKASQYTLLLAASESAEQLHLAIQNLEIEMALVSMEQAPYRADLPDRMEQWAADLFELQVKVLGLLFPKENQCYFSIYGKNPEPVLAFYHAFFEKKGFYVKQATAIWHRDGYVAPDYETNGEVGQPLPYLRQELFLASPPRENFMPPKPTDELYGIELVLTVNAVFTYLQTEEGLQHWDHEAQGKISPYYISISADEAPTPEGIHRQAFYQTMKARRSLTGTLFHDSRLNYSAQMKPSGRLAALQEMLDRLFELVLEQMFLGGTAEH